MNEESLRQALAHLNLGAIRYFDSVGSTNAEALDWAGKDAPHLALVIADEQTSGRGRLNRKWFTPRGSAIAASLILRPGASLRSHFSRLAGLAALAIASMCRELGAEPQIKWPNDVLINGKKIAGVLIETVWADEDVEALVVGMGVNVLREALPPAEALLFPAASLQDGLGKLPPAREAILESILRHFLAWLPRLGTEKFLQTWDSLLAFHGARVEIRAGEEAAAVGELLGLGADGDLQLRDEHDRIISIRYGDVSLRPAA